MTIIALSAFQDNYIWIIKNQADFICVDPGDAAPVLEFSKQEQRALSSILLTHHHADHIGGVRELKKHFPEVVVYSPGAYETLPSNSRGLTAGSNQITAELDPAVKPREFESIQLGDYTFDILSTPGHTGTHVCYVEPNQHWLFCGDTLFSAGCGRVFDGTMTELYSSLQQLRQLPDNTHVYCAHEYTRQNLKFALTVEPNNQTAREHLNFLEANPTQNSLPSTIGFEKQINPFLRLDEPAVQAFVAQHAPNAQTSEACFAYLRHAKDKFRG